MTKRKKDDNKDHRTYDNKKPGPLDAIYCKSSVPAFRGNPLIEALPDYLTYKAQEIQGRLALMPAPQLWGNNRRQRNSWLLAAAPHLFVAVGRHVSLFEVIDALIRTGYYYRNPLGKQNASYLADAYRRQQAGKKSQSSTATAPWGHALRQ